MSLLLDPLVEYEFMRLALAAAAVVGVTSSVLSCLLVVRHQSLLGDAISHAVLLGVVVGFLVGGQVGILPGALAVAVLAGLAITYVERHSPVKLDAVMGIVFTATFALGLALISVAQPRGIDLFHILFGDVLGVSPGDLALTAASGGLVLAVVIVGFRAFQLWSFDATLARAIGLPVGAMQYVFTALLSATVVASLQAVGLILVVAMLITPGATALLLTRRLATMMLVAAAIGLSSGVGGLYASYYLDVTSGPAIVVLVSVAFVLAFLLAPGRGVLAQRVERRRTARRTLGEDLVKAAYVPSDLLARTPLASLARVLGQPPGRVRGRAQALAREGLVALDGDGDGGGLRLTDAGAAEGLRLVRTHRLIEAYAHSVEQVPISELHEVAERREHEVSAAHVEDMARMLGEPASDPHGHPIPRERADLLAFAGRPLSDQPDDRPARVAMVGDDRDDLLGEMMRLGLLPRREVTVRGRAGGHLRVLIGDTEVELPAEIADRVYVVPA